MNFEAIGKYTFAKERAETLLEQLESDLGALAAVATQQVQNRRPGTFPQLSVGSLTNMVESIKTAQTGMMAAADDANKFADQAGKPKLKID